MQAEIVSIEDTQQYRKRLRLIYVIVGIVSFVYFKQKGYYNMPNGYMLISFIFSENDI